MLVREAFQDLVEVHLRSQSNRLSCAGEVCGGPRLRRRRVTSFCNGFRLHARGGLRPQADLPGKSLKARPRARGNRRNRFGTR